MNNRGEPFKMMNHNRFLRYAGFVLAAAFFLFAPISFSKGANGEDLEKSALKQADALLFRMSENPINEIKSVSLFYTVDMVSAMNVRLAMRATIKMEKKEKAYASSFTLTEPVGKDIWSWLLLNLFGKHTKEYKELIKGIETTLIESFHLEDGRFMTDVLEEFLPTGRHFPNQTAIKVRFDYDDAQIRFWEDKEQENFSKSLRYVDQVGPLTGFFNYIYFDDRFTSMRLVNALKLSNAATKSEADAVQKRVEYLFESEPVNLRSNNTGQHKEYQMCLFLEKGNFLDIIYGESMYYQLAHDAEKKFKMPYAGRVEGIISRSKKIAKIKRLKQKYPDREISQKEIFAQVDDILAAKNVKVYLEGFSVTLIGASIE
jgi:hypothetical protein